MVLKNPSRFVNWLGGVVDWDISNFLNKALNDSL